jgi:hypothetical protein
MHHTIDGSGGDDMHVSGEAMLIEECDLLTVIGRCRVFHTGVLAEGFGLEPVGIEKRLEPLGQRQVVAQPHLIGSGARTPAGAAHGKSAVAIGYPERSGECLEE